MGSTAKQLRTFVCDEDGAAIVFFALALPVLLLFLGLVIDIGLGRQTGHRLQIAADAAALAGASQLPDEGQALSEALSYSSMNYRGPDGYPVLKSQDVHFGRWTGSNFVAGAEPADAVQVTTRRAEANGNPLTTLFASLAGIDTLSIERVAIAHRAAAIACKGGGFFSEANVESGSNNDYTSDFCLYGAKGVKIGSDNSFGEGALVGMEDLSDFEQGGNNGSVDDALIEDEIELSLPGRVPGIVDSLYSLSAGTPDRANTILGDAPFNGGGELEIDRVVKINEITDTTKLESNTLYVVRNVADLGSDRTLKNVVIVAKDEVKVGSNSKIENALFASKSKVLFGSNNMIGAPGACEIGYYNVHVFANENIEFGSNNTLRGVFMAGREELKLGSDIAALDGVYAEVRGNIDYGSADSMAGCDDGLGSYFGEVDVPGKKLPLVLVY